MFEVKATNITEKNYITLHKYMNHSPLGRQENRQVNISKLLNFFFTVVISNTVKTRVSEPARQKFPKNLFSRARSGRFVYLVAV